MTPWLRAKSADTKPIFRSKASDLNRELGTPLKCHLIASVRLLPRAKGIQSALAVSEIPV
jgi:hypothetical protein